jgi:hypothetical protein
MADQSLTIRIAQALGLSTTLMFAGSTLSISVFLIPRLLESPTPLMLRQWGSMFSMGRKTGQPISLTAAASYFYLAYQAHNASSTSLALKHKAIGFSIAGGLCVAVVPFTLFFINDTNQKLLKKVEEVRGLSRDDKLVEIGMGEETAHKLVDWWGVLNFGEGSYGCVGWNCWSLDDYQLIQVIESLVTS